MENRFDSVKRCIHTPLNVATSTVPDYSVIVSRLLDITAVISGVSTDELRVVSLSRESSKHNGKMVYVRDNEAELGRRKS